MDSHETSAEGLTVKFIYSKPEDYKLHYINGAYGGLTPRGDLICNFFFEYKELPEEEEHIIEGDQLKLKPEGINTVPREVLREMKTGVIMTPDQAEKLASWLTEKVAEFKRTSKFS